MTPMMMARYFSKKVGGALIRVLFAALRRAAERDVADAGVTGADFGAPPAGGRAAPVEGVAPAGAPAASTGVVAGVGALVGVLPLVAGGWNVRDFLLTGLLVMGFVSWLDEPPPGGTPAEPSEEDHRKGERDDGAGQPGR